MGRDGDGINNDWFAKRYLTNGVSSPVKLNWPKYTPGRLVPSKYMIDSTDFRLDLGDTAGQPDACTKEAVWLLWIDTHSQDGHTRTYLVKMNVTITYLVMTYDPR